MSRIRMVTVRKIRENNRLKETSRNREFRRGRVNIIPKFTEHFYSAGNLYAISLNSHNNLARKSNTISHKGN